MKIIHILKAESEFYKCWRAFITEIRNNKSTPLFISYINEQLEKYNAGYRYVVKSSSYPNESKVTFNTNEGYVAFIMRYG